MNNTAASTPLYTIDTSSLLEMFREDRPYSKKHFPSLWENVLSLVENGEIISHIQILEEIKQFEGKDDELLQWAKSKKEVFHDYNLAAEQPIIAEIGKKFIDFVHQGKEAAHADPWLVAQAKSKKLVIITQEDFNPQRKKSKIPDICASMSIRCINLFGLVQERDWSF